MKINHNQLKQFVKIAYERKVPCFVWGTMGIGKSTQIKEVAKEIAKREKLGFMEGEADGTDYFSFIDVRISQLEPSDLRGIPIVQDGSTKWLTPNWLPKNEKSKGILFFDEINLAPPSIQSSAYQLILDRRLGDYKLPDEWIIISAGNTSDDRANVFELPAPLSNRYIHVDLNIPSKEEWVKWAIDQDLDTNIISFIERFPSHLYKFDRANKTKAFATPRTWEYTSKLIKGNDIDDHTKECLVASAVGDGVAHEFISFIKLQKKIDIDELLKNPELAKDIKEIDIKYSLLSALAERYREDNKSLEKILYVAMNLEAEFSILLLRFMKSIGKDKFSKDIIKTKVFKEITSKYGKYLIDTE